MYFSTGGKFVRKPGLWGQRLLRPDQQRGSMSVLPRIRVHLWKRQQPGL